MKKWTYLVAILAMVFATPVFTGCIDNEEPAGIEDLRTAKAELLRAKAAVEAAKVAQEEAKALQEQAKAKQEEAKAKWEEANAAQKAAEAAGKEAEAEKAKMEAEKAAAELEVYLMQQKAELAKAEAALEAALKDLALAKVALTDSQKAYLAAYIKLYEDAVKTLKSEKAEFEKAAETYAKAIKAKDDEEASKFWLREQKKNLAEAQAVYDAAVKAEALAKAAAETTPDAAALDAEYKELQDSLETLDKAGADYSVERAKLLVETEEEWETVQDSINYYIDLTGYTHDYSQATVTRAVAEYDDYGFKLDAEGNRVVSEKGSAEDMPMAPFSLDINYLPMGVSFTIPEIVTEGLTFKYSDYLNAVAADTTFETTKGEILKGIKAMAKELVRDANDDAWTAERIAALESNLETLAEEVEEAKAEWKKVVDIYTTGKVWADPSSLDGFDAVEAAAADYNEAVAAYNEAVAAVDEFVATLPNNDEFEELKDSIDAVAAEAIAAAMAEVTAWKNEYADKKAAYEATLETQTKTIARLEAEKLLLELTDTAAVAAKVKEIEAATAAKNVTDSLYNALNSSYTADYDSISAIANATVAVEQAKADEAIAKLTEEYIESEEAKAEYTALAAKKDEAKTALNEAYDALNNAIDEFRTANDLQDPNYPLYDSSLLSDAYQNTEEDEDGNSVWTPLPIEDATALVALNKEKVEEWLVSVSTELYGLTYDDTANKYGDLAARLEELTKEEMIADFYAAMMEEFEEILEDADVKLTLKPWILEMIEANKELIISEALSSMGGAFGEYLAAEQQIEIMKGYLENGDAIEALLADIDAAIASIDDDIAAATALVEAAEKSFTKLYDAYAAKFEDLDAKIEAATAATEAIRPVMKAIQKAIGTYMGYEDVKGQYVFTFNRTPDAKVNAIKDALSQITSSSLTASGGYTTGTITCLISTVEELQVVLEWIYAEAQEATYNAETELIKAEEALQKVIDGNVDARAEAEKAFKKAQEQLEEAEAELEKAQKALEAALARIGEDDLTADDAAMQGNK